MSEKNRQQIGRHPVNGAAQAAGEVRAGEASSGWKVGREFLPFHPDASHVAPEFRDGWNSCYQAAFESVARALPVPGVAGWLNRDGERILTARQKQSMEQHRGAAGKSAARGYTLPLVPGCLPSGDIEQLLHRVESAIRYAEAAVSPGNMADRQGEWGRVHAGRARSSHRQLGHALTEIAQLRAALATRQADVPPEGCTRLQVVTRHPHDYVLSNELDGTAWRGTSEGRWKHA